MRGPRHLQLVESSRPDVIRTPEPPGPTPEEGLRLIAAFRQINDPTRRLQLIQAAERSAGR